jgi:hypothetical protein
MTTPTTIIRMEIIFNELTGSLKKVIPIIETNKIPMPAQRA